MIAQIGGATIGYDDIGEGTAVVFLHAFPLNRTMWAAQTSALAAHWRCISLDFRGFGESAPTGPFSIDRSADDVAELLVEIGVRRAIVVGLSMGGYVAFAVWRRHASFVRALVLADTRAGADSAETRERRRELMALARTEGASAVADRQLVGLLGKTTRQRRRDIQSAVRAIAVSATVDGIVGGLEAMLDRPDSTPTLATLTIPTLILVGDEDVITPAKEARAMHKAIRGSRFELLANAGHLSSVERPAAFNAVLSEFLESVEEGSVGADYLPAMSSPNAAPISAAEQKRTARIGAMLFRNRSWLPVLFIGVPLLVPARMSAALWIIGAIFVVAGEWIRLAGVAAAGTVTRRRSRTVQRLVTYGIFAWVRNPLYVGNFLIWMGFTIISGVLWFLPIAVAIFALEYSLIVRYEEGVLESIFGGEYLAYKQSTPRWIPRPPKAWARGPHDWGEAWRSEVSTFLQYALLVVAFVLKQWWENRIAS